MGPSQDYFLSAFGGPGGREGMGDKKENGFSTVPGPSLSRDCPIARTKTRDSLAASDTRKETLEARDLNPW